MPSVGSADPRLLSSQPNEPCSGVRGQGRRLTRRSSWTELEALVHRGRPPAAVDRDDHAAPAVPARAMTPTLDAYAPFVRPATIEELRLLGDRLHGQARQNINSTAVGGGFAEILIRLGPLTRAVALP